MSQGLGPVRLSQTLIGVASIILTVQIGKAQVPPFSVTVPPAISSNPGAGGPASAMPPGMSITFSGYHPPTVEYANIWWNGQPAQLRSFRFVDQFQQYLPFGSNTPHNQGSLSWLVYAPTGVISGSIGASPNAQPPVISYGVRIENRTDEQRANAPKISIGVPLSDLGYLTSLQVGNDRAVILAAGLASDPGYPINPNGLELQYDENGVRKSVAIHVGLDGRFSGFAMADLGVNGTGGRALLIYHRTSGDDVNVGYYGDSAMFERRKEIKSLGRDSLRNIINEAVKNTGHFRWRSNGVVMGVRG